MIFKILFGIFWYICISIGFMIFLMVITRNESLEDKFVVDSLTIGVGFCWIITIPLLIGYEFYILFKQFLNKIFEEISKIP